jgi:short subunit dehydrogenase-like uncharacterized protein
MITLFGATGYTGRLTARQLATLELPSGSIRLAGRSTEKLQQLAAELPYQPVLLTADAADPSSLPPLFKDTRVLINCAGPFTDLGEPVVALAAMHGVHYLDTTNELGFVHRMRSYHQLAQNNQAAIVPACGFEVAFADSIAALLAQQLNSPLTTLDVIYALSGGNSSRGSRLSAIRSLGTSWLAYRGGEWVSAVPCTATRTVALPKGPRTALSFPSSEISTIPNHLTVDRVTTWMVISRRSSRWIKFVLPVFAGLARTPLAPLMGNLSASLIKPPSENLRTEDRWLVQVEAESHARRGSITLNGKGVYEITAKVVVFAAQQLLSAQPKQFGVIPPSVILPPKILLPYADENWDCEITALYHTPAD